MLKTFVKSILPLKVASLISNVLSGRNNVSWQARKKNSSLKAELIKPILDQHQVRNVLDIGCNAGQVSRSVSKNRFVVGLDGHLDPRGFENPFDGVALGQMRINSEVLSTIPAFDCVLLLSVHHQWIMSMDGAAADNLFSEVLKKARKVFIVEFASINEKYGKDQGFTDNDSASIQEYATTYLEKFVSAEQISYLGETPEFPGREPLRYMFAVNCSNK